MTLPDVLGKAASTHLDQNMYRFRSTNLEQIVKAALKLKHEDASLSAALEQAEDWLSRLKAMAEEVTLLRWWQELLFTLEGSRSSQACHHAAVLVRRL